MTGRLAMTTTTRTLSRTLAEIVTDLELEQPTLVDLADLAALAARHTGSGHASASSPGGCASAGGFFRRADRGFTSSPPVRMPAHTVTAIRLWTYGRSCGHT